MSKSQILDWYYDLTEEEVAALTDAQCQKVYMALEDEDGFYGDSLATF